MHNAEELKIFLALVQERLKDKRKEEFRFSEFEEKTKSAIAVNEVYSKYLYDALGMIYNERSKLNELKDKIFKKITIARIIKPSLKLDTIRILNDLGLEAPSNSGIHRSLQKNVKLDYREKISLAFIKEAKIKRASLLLYDVTTLYFEIDKENGRVSVDEKGFPLGLHSFEGNKAETKMLIPALKEFCGKSGVTELTVVLEINLPDLTVGASQRIQGVLQVKHSLPWFIFAFMSYISLYLFFLYPYS